jgi:hypothetical protein
VGVLLARPQSLENRGEQTKLRLKLNFNDSFFALLEHLALIGFFTSYRTDKNVIVYDVNLIFEHF